MHETGAFLRREPPQHIQRQRVHSACDGLKHLRESSLVARQSRIRIRDQRVQLSRKHDAIKLEKNMTSSFFKKLNSALEISHTKTGTKIINQFDLKT